MYLINGIPFDIDSCRTIGDIQYPPGFFKNMPEDELVNYGIAIIPDPVFKDERFYSNVPGADGEVISVPRPTEEVLREIFSQINSHRDDLTQNGGYKVIINDEPKWFHSDVFSRSQQLGLHLLGENIPEDKWWKTLDGSFVQMTPTVANSVFIAAAQSDFAIFQAAEVHKNALQSMQTVDEIATYDWRSFGWPETFNKY